MAELKTKKTEADVTKFIQGIADERRREECQTLVELMRDVTGSEPRIWGDSIVGFGDFHYKSSRSGREGDWFYVGFSPRKQALTIYLTYGLEQQEDLLRRLGRYKTGKACLYLSRLEGVDLGALRELVQQAVERQQAANHNPS